MTTPEAATKATIRQVLSEYGSQLYSYWPVPSGYGWTTLDCIGCYRGRFFAIEAKAPGKKPTHRQVRTTNDMELAMGTVFIIDSPTSPVLDDLCIWLNHLRNTINDDPHLTSDPVRRRPI